MTEPPELPPAPRPINPRAARRSWNERPVRVWLIIFLLVAAATGYFLYESLTRVMRERDLIYNGELVAATMTSIESSTLEGRPISRAKGPPVTLSYTLKDGREVKDLSGRLTPGIEGMVVVGSTLDIRVDPTDPRRWTDRTEPRPWSTELTVVFGLVPLLLLLLAAVWLSRMRVLSVWRNGDVLPASVIDTKQSSIAPRSRIIRFVRADDSGDQRVYSTLAPISAALRPGEPITLVAPKGNPARAIVADLYSPP